MKPLAEITDNCLEKMKPYQLFSWEKWWEKVIQNGSAPCNKTWAHYKFIQKRGETKIRINRELEARHLPERLICIGGGKGLYLVNEKTDDDSEGVAEITIDKRVSKLVRLFEASHKEMIGLADSRRLSDNDKKMLLRISDMVELQQNTMIGTISKMKSLPAVSKKRLLKHLGVVPNET